MARPGEIAAAVVYLASPGAEWASGAILDLNGASYLRWPEYLRWPGLRGHRAVQKSRRNRPAKPKLELIAPRLLAESIRALLSSARAEMHRSRPRSIGTAHHRTGAVKRGGCGVAAVQARRARNGATDDGRGRGA